MNTEKTGTEEKKVPETGTLEEKSPKMTKRIVKHLISAALMIGVLIAVMLEVLTLTEYLPEEREEVATNNIGWEAVSPGDSLKVLTWNAGYGALGDNADFFMDGGRKVETADKERVGINLAGIAEATAKLDPDVVFFQEIDRDASRSHHIDEMIELVNSFGEDDYPDYTSAFAYNMKVFFIPYPIPPIGMVQSGIMTLTRMRMASAERISLPCPFKWPVRLANFKRCLLVERLPVQKSDKELVLINLHLEAYDDGEGKQEQTQALMKILEEEASKGNYVIAAGDFNQTFSNTDISAYPLQEGKWAPGVFSVEEVKKEWLCLMDSSTPTCRSLDQPYEGADHSSFQYYVVDGYILSPNIEVRSCETQDLGFVYTDHNPVLLECVLK